MHVKRRTNDLKSNEELIEKEKRKEWFSKRMQEQTKETSKQINKCLLVIMTTSLFIRSAYDGFFVLKMKAFGDTI